MDERQRYDQLKLDIRRHDDLYYRQASAKIQDHDYDALMRELKELEAAHPEWVTPDSPSQVVNGVYPNEPQDADDSNSRRINRVEHSVPMLSIDNTYSLNDLTEWANKTQKYLSERTRDDKIEWVVELKIDGVSGALIYEKGVLKQMITRGDGQRGDDYSANAVMLTNIPKRIELPSAADASLHKLVDEGKIEVRGEIFMTNEDLVALNLIREQEGLPPFANTRNLTAGSIGLGYDDKGRDVLSLRPEDVDEKDRAKLAKEQPLLRLERSRRKLGFFFHSLGSTEGLPVKTHWDFLKLVETWGFAPTPMAARFDSFEKVKSYCESVIEKLDELNFEIDGLVIKVNSLEQRAVLGDTVKSPRWVIAYKFKKYEALTTVLDIRLQVGKSGVITPVADVQPCEIAGTTVSRSSLHNFDELRRKDIRIGDVIVMEKAGKIIPHVVRTEKHLRKAELPEFPLPSECPVCREPVVKDPETVYWRCVNPDCPAQLKEKIRYFATRGAMDITGLGDKNVDKLVDSQLIGCFADIYRLKDRRDEMIKLFYAPETKEESKTTESPISEAELAQKATIAEPLDDATEKANVLEGLELDALPPESVLQEGQVVARAAKRRATGKKKSTSTLMVDNLLAAIERSKNRGLALLLNGLSIQHVGSRVATVLARHFKTAAALMRASEEELSAINEIGPKIAQSVWTFFHLPDGSPAHGQKTVEDLAEMGVLVDIPGYVPEKQLTMGLFMDFDQFDQNVEPTVEADSSQTNEVVAQKPNEAAADEQRDSDSSPIAAVPQQIFEGLPIVVTGTLKHFNRQDIERLIESLGGRASSSVSKKTAFVIAGEEAGSKRDKALTLGVPIISEEQFLEKANAAGNID